MTTLELVLAHASSHDQRSEAVVRPRVPKVVQSFTRAPHLEDVDGDARREGPRRRRNPRTLRSSVRAASPFAGRPESVAAVRAALRSGRNDYGHVIGEDVLLTLY